MSWPWKIQVESSWFQASQPDVVVFAIATSGRNLARSPPAVKIQLRNGWDHFQLSCQREGGHKRTEHCEDIRGVSHCEGTNKITFIMFGPKTIHLYNIYTSKYCCQSDDTEKISPQLLSIHSTIDALSWEDTMRIQDYDKNPNLDI